MSLALAQDLQINLVLVKPHAARASISFAASGSTHQLRALCIGRPGLTLKIGCDATVDSRSAISIAFWEKTSKILWRSMR